MELQTLKERVSRRKVLQAAGGAIGVSLMSGSGSAQEGEGSGRGEGQRGNDLPYICAHRGFRDVFPENTVAAVEGSSFLGVPRIEIDLEATADGEIVVFHDEELDDLTDMEGVVAEMPASEVTQAEVLGSGQTVPTLAETLDAALPNVLMNLEFKDRGPLSWEEFTRATFEVANEHHPHYYASSFDHDAIRAVREVDPEIAVAPIFGDNKEENLEVARELDAEAVNCSLDVLDEDLVQTAHDEGRQVNVWTVDSWQEAAEPIELGVDGLIADYTHMTTYAAGKEGPAPFGL